MWVSFGSLVLALLLIPLGIVGFEYMPPVDRGELFVTINYPTGTPLTRPRQMPCARPKQIVDRVPDLQSETSIAGAYQGALTGYINNGAIAQIHVFLKERTSQSTQYWSQSSRVRFRVRSRARR